MTDVTTYCDVNTCTDCPRYGDDCDGEKLYTHEEAWGMTDLISRADAIDACCRGWNNTAEDCIRNIKALPSAELPNGELISKADVIGIIEDYIGKDYMTPMSRLYSVRSELSALPSADAKLIMTEEVREALMRLTMCAREECDMCKYNDECGYDFQYKISTDNMNTLSDALLRSKCKVDAKLADAVQGEWIKKQVFNPELDKYVPMIECSVCGYEPYFGGSESKFNYCANCGTRMKGGAE